MKAVAFRQWDEVAGKQLTELSLADARRAIDMLPKEALPKYVRKASTSRGSQEA